MAKMKTQINCPQCRQPIMADIQQVFDVGADPADKQQFLSGQYNLAQCPQCGFYGNMSTPMVYHDPEKELLLTFVPGELNLPMAEQEKVLGRLIKQVVDSLPLDQRKGYLLSPQRVLTLQGLVERILAEEGISKEMIEAQEKMVGLIQRLATITSEEALKTVVEEEDEMIDETFFLLMNRLIEESLSHGDQNATRQLSELQQRILPHSTFGRELQARSKEVEEAISTLQALGEELTREKLLDLVIEAPNETRLEAYASVARNGMDYEFFQLLSEKIEAAEGEEKEKLTALRERLLEFTAEIDKQIEERMEIAKQNLERVIEQENIPAVVQANLPAIDEFFVQMVNQEYAAAQQNGNEERAAKLKQVIDTLVEASKQAQSADQSSGQDMELIQVLLEAEDTETRMKVMEENAERINSAFVEALTSIRVQMESSPEQEEMAGVIRTLHQDVTRFFMQRSMQQAE